MHASLLIGKDRQQSYAEEKHENLDFKQGTAHLVSWQRCYRCRKAEKLRRPLVGTASQPGRWKVFTADKVWIAGHTLFLKSSPQITS